MTTPVQEKHVTHTRLDSKRRVTLPDDLCRRYGSEPGTPIALELTDSWREQRRNLENGERIVCTEIPGLADSTHDLDLPY